MCRTGHGLIQHLHRLLLRLRTEMCVFEAAVTPLPIRAAEAILNRGLGKVVELAGEKVDPD